MKNAVLISNPLAGVRSERRSRQVHEAVAALRSAGIAVDCRATSCPGDGRQLAREAVQNGCDLVIVCGGDGTINEVINGLAPGRVPLAILPGGTANIVAKELGLPGHIVKAARQLPSWRPCRIPLGRANWEETGSVRQRFFLAVAGVGFDARIISQLNMGAKLRMGVVAYAWEAVRQVFRYSFPSFQFSMDGSTVSATFAVIQRSRRYAGWLKLARRHSIREPDFSCCMFEGSGPGRYFRYALGILTQTHQRLGDVRFLNGSSVHCRSEQAGDPIFFEVDGELAGRIPVTFEVVPDALTLLAPEPFLSSTA
ncbi:MAG: diacylglycerol kinase family protein [Terriglobia bacterium]